MATPTEQALQGFGDKQGYETTAAEEHPQGQLLGEPKATKALLQFLASTNVALPRTRLQQTVERAWKHWRRRLEQEKGSREGSPKLTPSSGHTHPAPKHKESILLESPAHTSGLGRGKGPERT